MDGHINYSKLASVEFRFTAAQFIIYPNPLTTGNLNILLPKAATVSLYNSTGVLLLCKQMPSGAQQLTIGKLPKCHTRLSSIVLL